MKPLPLVLVLGMAAMMNRCAPEKREAARPSDLAAKISRFAPADVSADLTRLSPGDRQALQKLVEAAGIMDRIYTRQVWSGNEALRAKLEADTSTAGKERLHYYSLNQGPWSKLDQDEPFLEGVPAQKPPQAHYYPDDMTKEEFTAWAASLPEPSRRLATGFFTTIHRNASHGLTIVPYSEEYKDLLLSAGTLLREAAALTTNQTLRSFLAKRADAFESNDYYESDVAWMDLDSPIEPTIGPYEVYMDELFNYKAAFEAFICIRDDAETGKLSMFSRHLQEIEDHLPIAPKYRNPKLGALAPIRVVDEVATGGEARAGIQTAAFNLPNDERVTAEKGSKRVMLKNVQEAKFRMILTPIAKAAIDSTQQGLIAFEPFFTHILAHELMHGLGPHTIVAGGRTTTVRQEMRELSSALEEAKADISGLFALQYLIDKGIVDKSMEQSMYVTYVAGVFRSVRFGTNDAHGKGMALQFNFLSDEGAISCNPSTGRFTANVENFKKGAKKLTQVIMTIQAEGSYDKAKALFDRYAVIRPEMQRTLDALTGIPVDIEPHFTPLQ